MVDEVKVKALTRLIKDLYKEKIEKLNKGIMESATDKKLIEATCQLLSEVVHIGEVIDIYNECSKDIHATTGVVYFVLHQIDPAESLMHVFDYVTHQVVERHGLDKDLVPALFPSIAVGLESFMPQDVKDYMMKKGIERVQKVYGSTENVKGYG